MPFAFQQKTAVSCDRGIRFGEFCYYEYRKDLLLHTILCPDGSVQDVRCGCSTDSDLLHDYCYFVRDVATRNNTVDRHSNGSGRCESSCPLQTADKSGQVPHGNDEKYNATDASKWRFSVAPTGDLLLSHRINLCIHRLGAAYRQTIIHGLPTMVNLHAAQWLVVNLQYPRWRLQKPPYKLWNRLEFWGVWRLVGKALVTWCNWCIDSICVLHICRIKKKFT